MGCQAAVYPGKTGKWAQGLHRSTLLAISAQAVGDLAFRSLGPWAGLQASSCWELSETTQPGPSTSHLLPRYVSGRGVKALDSKDLLMKHPPHALHLQERLALYPLHLHLQ